MSYFVFYCRLCICKLERIDYLDWGRVRANSSAIVYLWLCGFCSVGFPLPLGAWDRPRCFIVALPGHAI